MSIIDGAGQKVVKVYVCGADRVCKLDLESQMKINTGTYLEGANEKRVF